MVAEYFLVRLSVALLTVFKAYYPFFVNMRHLAADILRCISLARILKVETRESRQILIRLADEGRNNNRNSNLAQVGVSLMCRKLDQDFGRWASVDSQT